MIEISDSGQRIPSRQSRVKRAEIQSAVASLLLKSKHDFRPPFKRHERKRKAKPAVIVAYDLETDRIKVGTPAPRYITAFSPDFELALTVRDMKHLHWVLTTHFLTHDKAGTKYVAWNANRFDAYFIAAALVFDGTYTLRPYMTKNKTLRGLRVELTADDRVSWEFLDGIAMLGLQGVILEKLLKNFAPNHQKLTGNIDFDKEEFDPSNADHCAYAMRDSVGVWYALDRAQRIMLDTFNEPLAVTMGGMCIKIFQAHIPRDVVVESLIPDLELIVRRYVARGGYCYCAQRYKGPVWKYDLNQAYAAAMRDAALPCGSVIRISGEPPTDFKAYIVRIKATRDTPTIPFYYRTDRAGRVTSVFGADRIDDTWITSVEHQQLISEGWNIRCLESWVWSDSFNMRDYVDKLERLRMSAVDGPSGPEGTMYKGTGNHSFGKTLERIEPIEYVIAAECPDDCLPYYGDGSDPIEHIYYRIDPDRKPKAYHQPHIGAWITAHCRMVLRRAALLAPDAWLYADTDCVVFSRDITSQLDIDPKRYGAWKVEEAGTEYRIIAKKVYAEVGGSKRSAKGLNVRRLTDDDFEKWFEGDEPVQDQVQVQNFLAVLCGAEMFRGQRRHGTRVEARKATTPTR